MKKFTLNTLVIAFSSLALVGCGDSETNIVELPPTVVDKGDGHHHDDELGKGRLAIADKDNALVHIFSLEDNSLIESVSITNPATELHASPGNRYAIAVQVDAVKYGNIEYIDGGVWQEPHGDHFHQHEDAPALISYDDSGYKPAHYVPRGDKAVLFFDGTVESSTTGVFCPVK